MTLRLRLRPQRLVLALAGLAAIGLALGFMTWLFVEVFDEGPAQWERFGGGKWILLHLSLGQENVIATWFSSMLMLIVAVVAVANYLLSGRESARGARFRRWPGWVAVAALFALLSFDEMGSLHEHATEIDALNALGGQGSGWQFELLLVGLVGLLLLVLVRQLHRLGAGVLPLLVGIGILAVVPIQERISILEVGTSAGGITHALEELAEVGAMIAFLAAMLAALVSQGTRSPPGAATGDGVASVSVRRKSLWLAAGGLIVGFALALVFAEVLMRTTSVGDDGIPQNWPTSALAAVAGLLGLASWRMAAPGSRRAVYLLAGLVSIAVSVYYGANFQGWVPFMGETAQGLLPWLQVTLFSAAAVIGLGLATSPLPAFGKLAALGYPILIGIGFLDSGPVAGPLELAASALLLGSLVSGIGLPRLGVEPQPALGVENRVPAGSVPGG